MNFHVISIFMLIIFKRLALILFFLHFYIVNTSGGALHSPKSLLISTNDSVKVDLLISIAAEFYSSSNYDSAIFYANLALDLSENQKYLKGQSKASEVIAEVYFDKELYDSTILFFSKSIEAKQILGDKKGEAYCLHVIGLAYRKLNKLERAIDYEFKSLKIAEEICDQRRIGYVSNGIAIIYQTLKQYPKAIYYYEKLLKISIELNDEKDIADAYNNLGTVHMEMKEFDKAYKYYFKAFKIYQKVKDRPGLALVYSNIGNVYLEKHKMDSAILFQERGLRIELELDNREGIADSYENIASIYYKSGDYDKSVAMYRSALSYTKENDLIQLIYDKITRAYIHLGDSDNAIHYHNLSLSLKDSIYNRETKNIIAELQTKYETEKKESEIKILTKENELKSLRLKKNSILLYSVSGILLLIVVLVIVILSAYRAKNKANQLLVQKNTEILAQKEEIETQRDKIEEQRDTLAKQTKNITDSILYAQRIQQAVLPTAEAMQTYLPDHFVLFKPRDIVSGDFYWLKPIQNLVVFAVVDCTGHGVPGAFMSMLGVSFLNEIVNDKEVASAGEALNRLRDMVKASLHQKGVVGEQRDGMDLALCVFDTNTLQLQYSGAHNPFYLLRNGVEHTGLEGIVDLKLAKSNSHTLFEVKASRQTVSIAMNEVDFKTHTIQLEKGDTFYLLSDGFQDQLGGDKYEKFKAERLKNLLLEIGNKPMGDQMQLMDRAHVAWQNGKDQVDDILVLGVRV